MPKSQSEGGPKQGAVKKTKNVAPTKNVRSKKKDAGKCVPRSKTPNLPNPQLVAQIPSSSESEQSPPDQGSPEVESLPTQAQSQETEIWDRSNTTMGQTRIIHGIPSDQTSHTANSLSDPNSSQTLGPTVEVDPARAGVVTMATSIEGAKLWMNQKGDTFKQTDAGIFWLDESIPKWILLKPVETPQAQPSGGGGVMQTAPETGRGWEDPAPACMPVRPGNSWTNVQVRDVQEIMSRQAGASPLAAQRAGQITVNQTEITCLCDMVDNLGPVTGAVNPMEPQPGTSGQQELLQPTGVPIGRGLRRSLYSHVPQSMREKAVTHSFVQYKQLLVDPLLPIKGKHLTMVRDLESGKVEWVENSSVKEITNFDQWLRAHNVYSAMYVDAHPDKATDLINYQNVIHDAAMRYD